MIDWERVNALRDEVGEEDFDEVVELFLEEVDAEITTLQEASEAESLGNKLHFLKGSAMSLGFRKFSNLCQLGEATISKDAQAQVNLADILSCYHLSREEFLANLSQKISG